MEVITTWALERSQLVRKLDIEKDARAILGNIPDRNNPKEYSAQTIRVICPSRDEVNLYCSKNFIHTNKRVQWVLFTSERDEHSPAYASLLEYNYPKKETGKAGENFIEVNIRDLPWHCQWASVGVYELLEKMAERRTMISTVFGYEPEKGHHPLLFR